MQHKLLASSNSLEGITKLIGEYFCSNQYTLMQRSETHFDLVHKGKDDDFLKTFTIIKKNGRFRLYSIDVITKGE